MDSEIGPFETIIAKQEVSESNQNVEIDFSPTKIKFEFENIETEDTDDWKVPVLEEIKTLRQIDSEDHPTSTNKSKDINKTPPKIWRCLFCTTIFKEWPSYEDHMQKKHNKNLSNLDKTKINEKGNTPNDKYNRTEGKLGKKFRTDGKNSVKVETSILNICNDLFYVRNLTSQNLLPDVIPTGDSSRTKGKDTIKKDSDSDSSVWKTNSKKLSKFQCGDCGLIFNLKYNLEQHMTNKHSQSIISLTLHQQTQHENTAPFKCNVCGDRFQEEIFLTSHRQLHDVKVPFNCSKCSLQFTSKDEGNLHVMEIHKGAAKIRLGMNVINKVMNSIIVSEAGKDKLEENQSWPRGDKGSHDNSTAVVPKCSSSIGSQKEQQISKYNSVAKFQCKICKLDYKFYVRLVEHVTRFHKINLELDDIDNYTEEIYLTEETGGSYRRTLNGKRQVRYRGIESESEESSSNDKFYKKKKHSKLYKEESSTSSEEYISGSDLNDDDDEDDIDTYNYETDVHSDKIFSCDICGKEFQNITVYNRHAKLHEVDALLVCCVCNKKMSSLDELGEHYADHKKKNVAVTEASKDLNSINKSIRTRNNKTRKDQPHQFPLLPTVRLDSTEFHCHFCPKTFNSRTTLKIHLKKHEDKIDSLDSSHDIFVVDDDDDDDDQVIAGLTKSKEYKDVKYFQKISASCSNKSLQASKSTKSEDKKDNQDEGLPCILCNNKFTSSNELIQHYMTHQHKSDSTGSSPQANSTSKFESCRKVE